MDLGIGSVGMKGWTGSLSGRRDDTALCLLTGLPAGLAVSMPSQPSADDAVFQNLSCSEGGGSHTTSLLCDLDNPVGVARSENSGAAVALSSVTSAHKCPLCHRQFAKESSLKNHVKSHNKVLLPQHQLVTGTSGNQQQMLMQQSQLSMIQQQQQQLHDLSHQMNHTVCKSCFKSFNNSAELKEHRKLEHGDMNETADVMCAASNASHAGSLLLGNNSCGTNNLIGACNLGSTNGALGLDSVSTPSHYQCSECGKSMKSAARLYAHFSAAHTTEASQYRGSGGGGATQAGGDPGGQYACHVCGLGLSRPDRLKSHVMTHTGEKPYACTVCSHRFRRSDKLMIHMRIHTGERNYACPDCDMRFMRSDHLKNHRRIHSGERPYRCNQCDACFMRSDKLTHHMKVHREGNPDSSVDFLAACASGAISKFMDTSSGSGSDGVNLSAAISTSGGEGVNNSQWVGQTKGTLMLDDLRANDEIHEAVSQGLMGSSNVKQDDDIDDDDDDDEDDDEDRKISLGNEDNSYCNEFNNCMRVLCQQQSIQCKAEKKSKSHKLNEICSQNMQQQQQQQHMESVLGSLQGEQQQHQLQPQQQQLFHSQSQLPLHLYSFKPYIDPRPSVVPNPPAHPPPAVYPCMQTGMIGNYRFSANLLKQLTNAVTAYTTCKSQDKPYHCTQCDSKFARASGLSMHTLTHSGQKSHHCTMCQKSFFHESKLKSHISTHHPDGTTESLRCEYCQKEFTRVDRLRNHTRIHTGERKFACVLCTKAFTRSDHLKIHMRIHTGEKPYRCTDCDKSYARSDKLKKHVKTHIVDIGGGSVHIVDIGGGSVPGVTSSSGLIGGGMT